jgi:hypothetical protein
MDGRCQIDTLLLEGAAIDTDIESRQRQVPVLGRKPSIAQTLKSSVRRPKARRRFAGIVTDGWPSSRDCDLLGAEPVFGQRPQCRHQMDVRIAGSIVKDPVGDHAFGGMCRSTKSRTRAMF